MSVRKSKRDQGRGRQAARAAEGRPRKLPTSVSEQERLAYIVAALRWGKEGMSQAAIAERLGIGQMQVSRLLVRAEELGFVSPRQLSAGLNHQLEADLLRAFPALRRASVVYADQDMHAFEDHVDAVAACAAQFWWDYALRSQESRVRVGLGGGRAVARLVDRAVIPQKAGNIELYALSNIPTGDEDVSSNTNVAVLKRRYPRRYTDGQETIRIHQLLAMQLSPEMDEDAVRRERDRIMGLSIVQNHVREAAQCQIAFVGVGSFEDENLWDRISRLGLRRADIPRTAIGDLIYNLIYDDEEVFHEDCPLNTRLITVPVTSLMGIARRPDSFVVVVAWGAAKARPAAAALRVGAYNALICDVDMARAMLDLATKQQAGGT